MKILREGHEYELEDFENDNVTNQILQFIEKVPEGKNLITVNSGTTNEEVLAVLINRLRYLNTKFPCRENSIVITKLEESLMWLEHRTKLRQRQNVEGMQLPHEDNDGQ